LYTNSHRESSTGPSALEIGTPENDSSSIPQPAAYKYDSEVEEEDNAEEDDDNDDDGGGDYAN